MGSSTIHNPSEGHLQTVYEKRSVTGDIGVTLENSEPAQQWTFIVEDNVVVRSCSGSGCPDDRQWEYSSNGVFKREDGTISVTCVKGLQEDKFTKPPVTPDYTRQPNEENKTPRPTGKPERTTKPNEEHRTPRPTGKPDRTTKPNEENRTPRP